MFYLYSKSTKYAIITLAYISRKPAGEYTKIREIAENCKIPIQYLAKLVEGLRDRGLVGSLRGPTGGLQLNLKASEICIEDIVKAIDESSVMDRSCLLGRGACHDDHTCALHDKWKKIRKDIYEQIEKKTLDDIRDLLPELFEIERKN